MKYIACGVLLFGMASLVADGSPRSVFTNSNRPQSARVSILAMSTSVRLSSGNQEVYLADIVLKDGRHHLAKLVDLYSEDGSPIPVYLLRERRLLKMRVVRDPACDLTGGTFFLPSDEGMLFDASARTSLADNQANALPCFKADHKTIQFAGR